MANLEQTFEGIRNPLNGIPEEPWWIPAAIEYVDNYLKDGMMVLEFGCGGSTIWLSKRTNLVVSVEEEDRRWAYAVDKQSEAWKTGHPTVLWKIMPMPATRDENIDLLILDGGDRVKHGVFWWPYVKVGGIMMLDDSQRHDKYDHLIKFMDGVPCDILTDNWNGKEIEVRFWKKQDHSRL